MQQNLRSDQAEIGHQRDQLETERREIAEKRHRDPIIAATIMQIGMVIACLLPLGVCVYLLWSLRHAHDSDAAVAELLIEEIVSDNPRLLPSSRPLPALTEGPGPELKISDTSNDAPPAD